MTIGTLTQIKFIMGLDVRSIPAPIRQTEVLQKRSRLVMLMDSRLNSLPDYNVAPQTMQPVIVWDEEFGTRTLHMMFWRFLSRFVTDPKKFKLVND